MTRPDLRPYLGQTVNVIVDRPLGSKHPQWDHIWYSFNYGYLPGTLAGDGEEIDAYILGVFQPIEQFEGQVIAIIRRRDDVEDKLVVAPPDKNYTRQQVTALVEFIERMWDSEVVMAR